MNRRHFFVLLIAAVVVIALITVLIPGQGDRDRIGPGGLLLQNIAPRINQADQVVISAAGGLVTTLQRKETYWAIRELSDYPANWGKLRSLLSDLAQATVMETKTSNPDYYSRLGVEDMSSENATGLLLEVSIAEESASLIIGNSAGSLGGQFVRLAEQPQSVLTDRALDLTAEPIDWADATILDIGSALIAEIEILHPDGDRILASKISADDADFTLENIPPGRSLVSSWSVNSLASVFSLLRMERVQPDVVGAEAEPVIIRALTFSGLEVLTELFEIDGQSWLRIRANPELQQDTAENAGSPVVSELQSEAEAINEKTRGWLFGLPESRLESMKKRLEQLLAPPGETENAES